MQRGHRGGYDNYRGDRERDVYAEPLPYYNREQRGGRGGAEFRGGRGGGAGYGEERNYGGPRPGGDYIS